MDQQLKSIIAIDIGVKNLSYVVVEGRCVKNITLISLGKRVEDVIDFLQSILLNPDEVSIVLIEKQLKQNTLCLRIETVIVTYCYLNKINYKLVHPNNKYTHYHHPTSSYYQRKKWVVQEGNRLFTEYFDHDISNYSKKDDICDCIIMIYLHQLQSKKCIT